MRTSFFVLVVAVLTIYSVQADNKKSLEIDQIEKTQKKSVRKVATQSRGSRKNINELKEKYNEWTYNNLIRDADFDHLRMIGSFTNDQAKDILKNAENLGEDPVFERLKEKLNIMVAEDKINNGGMQRFINRFTNALLGLFRTAGGKEAQADPDQAPEKRRIIQAITMEETAPEGPAKETPSAQGPRY